MRELPTRIQRKRTKGDRLPNNTLCVTRPHVLSSPFKVVWSCPLGALQFAWYVYGDRRAITYRSQGFGTRYGATCYAVGLFDAWLRQECRVNNDVANALGRLTDYDHIACWCKPTAPCHGDVLLALLAERVKEKT